MPTLLFVSGKNWILSLAELTNYFGARKIGFEIQFFSGEFFIISFVKPLDSSTISDLGGTIKIGDVKAKFPTETFKDAFLRENKKAKLQIIESVASSGLIDGMSKLSEKVLFGVSVYCADSTLRTLSMRIQRFIGSSVKKELSSLDKKSRFIGFASDRKSAQLSNVEVLKKNLVENRAELLCCIGRRDTWIGTTVAVHNPFEFQKRDVYKPNQRKIFAMPPRIAKIMVNLSACTSMSVLVDPFCGVGTILQEALLERARVLGLDVNPWCVKSSCENLEWLVREYRLEHADFRVLQGDVNRLVEKVGKEAADCIVSEPDLGPALKMIPTVSYAEKIIRKLEPLYFGFIEQAYRTLKTNGRLVLVSPYIKSRSGKPITIFISKKIDALGLKRVYSFTKDMFSQSAGGLERLTKTSAVVDIDERHIVGREIHILEK